MGDGGNILIFATHAYPLSLCFYTPHLRTHEVLCTWHVDDGYMDKEEGKERKTTYSATIYSKLSPLNRVIPFTWLVNSYPVSTSIFALFHIYLVSCEIYKVMMT